MLMCTLGGSLGLPKLPSVHNGPQGSGGICLLVEITLAQRRNPSNCWLCPRL